MSTLASSKLSISHQVVFIAYNISFNVSDVDNKISQKEYFSSSVEPNRSDYSLPLSNLVLPISIGLSIVV
jgi:hypothetical protein